MAEETYEGEFLPRLGVEKQAKGKVVVNAGTKMAKAKCPVCSTNLNRILGGTIYIPDTGPRPAWLFVFYPPTGLSRHRVRRRRAARVGAAYLLVLAAPIPGIRQQRHRRQAVVRQERHAGWHR